MEVNYRNNNFVEEAFKQYQNSEFIYEKIGISKLPMITESRWDKINENLLTAAITRKTGETDYYHYKIVPALPPDDEDYEEDEEDPLSSLDQVQRLADWLGKEEEGMSRLFSNHLDEKPDKEAQKIARQLLSEMDKRLNPVLIQRKFLERIANGNTIE